MEWQRRGLLHVHLLVRGEVPADVVERAVRGAGKTESRRSITPASHAGHRWGPQVDVQHIEPKDRDHLIAYITKMVTYAIKDVDRSQPREEVTGSRRAPDPDGTGRRGGRHLQQLLLGLQARLVQEQEGPRQHSIRDWQPHKPEVPSPLPRRASVRVSRAMCCPSTARGARPSAMRVGRVRSGRVLSIRLPIRCLRPSSSTWERIPQHPAPAGCLDVVEELVTHPSEAPPEAAAPEPGRAQGADPCGHRDSVDG